ncbi:P-loop NTPase fold protein [Mucilaginibacter sp.]|uniref:KAP family P-loop NTPase fold protein n=1 Tax=Mucilaginibacter sp. TaxID=1882438 RepID=UPI002846ED15|nr:P-loop NTPase fold protein [Mucilaginibacter sp.]MDR3695191.1 P-loop NTPase fold protein [Mucilaginibacter sp.]
MNTNLLYNRELEDYQKDDSFNFIVKADAIKLFLEYNSIALEKNKMLVLYGDWGSGKTSLMKHIESEINKDIYHPIFFHAWEHEKDENLPLSLCDALVNSIEISNYKEVIKDFMNGAFLTLKSFTSGITLKAPGYLTGLGLDLEFSGEKYMKAIDEGLAESIPVSFYKSNKEFKDNFQKIEELILKRSGAQKILIFIDDLDRCEPENVLNLITALKLFFTYGEKSVFLCGIDKNAVTKAVKTRYKDVIKSEEYMEKVFDIAFNMPKTFSLKKILEPHFFDLKKILHDGHTVNSTDVIEDFFRSIKFTNPRHLKKVLNKYEILKSFKALSTIPEDFRSLIPNIIENEKTGKVFETIYCLFIIILYEFNLDEFEEVEDYEQKMIKYTDILRETRTTGSNNYNKVEAANDLNRFISFKDIDIATFNVIKNGSAQLGGRSYGFSKFLYIFSNSTPTTLGFIGNDELFRFAQYFPDNKISTNFCKFLIKYEATIVGESADSEYIIRNLFSMVKYLL